MALKLSRKKPQFVPVTFEGGAVWRLRPATSIDVEIAGQRTARQLAGIVSGSAAVEQLSETFGSLVDIEEPATPEAISAATMFLTDVNLAVLCGDGWTDFSDDDGNPVPVPTPEWIALLLSDHQVRSRVQRVLYAGLHEVVDDAPADQQSKAPLGPSVPETHAGTKGSE
jgi:hypothetical protein